MKKLFIALSAAFGFGLLVFRSPAELEVSVGVSIQSPDDFYQPLSSEGMWVTVGSYGRCWRPAGVTAEWRPYCNGHWEWTDCGWYWVSDEPWSWACYHYGSWFYDGNYGWVWVPGVEWAPAWVYWRTGGDYIGWAPCSPRGVEIEPANFVFVQEGHFHEHIRPDRVIVNNTTVINQTTIIHNNIQRERRDVDGRNRTVVVNNGPRVDVVSRATHHEFTATPVQKVNEQTYRSVPERIRRPASTQEMGRPQNTGEQTKPNTDFHRETPNIAPRQEVPTPQNIPPQRDRTVPYDRGMTTPQEPSRTAPPIQERTIPQEQPRMVPQERERIIPQDRERVIPQEQRTIPQPPPASLTPPVQRELPSREVPHQDESQSPRGFAPPPSQHPPAQVAPPAAVPHGQGKGFSEPSQKGQDGDDHKHDHQQ